MRKKALFLPLMLGGCVVKTAVDVVTLPVRATVGVVKTVSPSQAKKDQKRGRKARKAEQEGAAQEQPPR